MCLRVSSRSPAEERGREEREREEVEIVNLLERGLREGCKRNRPVNWRDAERARDTERRKK